MIIGAIIHWIPKNTLKKTKQNEILISKKETKIKEKSTEEEKYQIDIKGEVQNPGIYNLSKNARIYDAIQAAGGLTTEANTTVINLSKKIADEMVIIIYSNQEVKDFKKTKEQESRLLEQCRKKDSDALENNACIDDIPSKEQPAKISLNKATVEQLMTLPGIGETKATDIVNYRNEIGEFKNIEEIKNISGIGDSIFAKIKEYLTL